MTSCPTYTCTKLQSECSFLTTGGWLDLPRHTGDHSGLESYSQGCILLGILPSLLLCNRCTRVEVSLPFCWQQGTRIREMSQEINLFKSMMYIQGRQSQQKSLIATKYPPLLILTHWSNSHTHKQLLSAQLQVQLLMLFQ